MRLRSMQELMFVQPTDIVSVCALPSAVSFYFLVFSFSFSFYVLSFWRLQAWLSVGFNRVSFESHDSFFHGYGSAGLGLA